MTQEEKIKLAKFCYKNLHTHSGWVETISEYESIFSFINKLIKYTES